MCVVALYTSWVLCMMQENFNVNMCNTHDNFSPIYAIYEGQCDDDVLAVLTYNSKIKCEHMVGE